MADIAATIFESLAKGQGYLRVSHVDAKTMPSENSRLDARKNGKIISGAKLQQPDRILIAHHLDGGPP